MAHSIRIPSNILQELFAHTSHEQGNECCGLLAGRDRTITRAYRAENVAANPSTSYEVATKEIVSLTREIRNAGLEMIGIYHSHPNGKGQPSDTDIAAASYPDVAHFIIAKPPDSEMAVRAFLIRGGEVEELNIVIV